MPPLQALVDADCEVALVVTQPDRRRGRGSDLVASPVKLAAEGLALPVCTPGRAAEIADAAQGLALGDLARCDDVFDTLRGILFFRQSGT